MVSKRSDMAPGVTVTVTRRSGLRLTAGPPRRKRMDRPEARVDSEGSIPNRCSRRAGNFHANAFLAEEGAPECEGRASRAGSCGTSVPVDGVTSARDGRLSRKTPRTIASEQRPARNDESRSVLDPPNAALDRPNAIGCNRLPWAAVVFALDGALMDCSVGVPARTWVHHPMCHSVRRRQPNAALATPRPWHGSRSPGSSTHVQHMDVESRLQGSRRRAQFAHFEGDFVMNSS